MHRLAQNTIALQQMGVRFALIFYWNDTDAPDETRQQTDFTEAKDYVRSIYEMIVREPHAPRKLAEEIARARKQGKAEARERKKDSRLLKGKDKSIKTGETAKQHGNHESGR